MRVKKERKDIKNQKASLRAKKRANESNKAQESVSKRKANQRVRKSKGRSFKIFVTAFNKFEL